MRSLWDYLMGSSKGEFFSMGMEEKVPSSVVHGWGLRLYSCPVTVRTPFPRNY